MPVAALPAIAAVVTAGAGVATAVSAHNAQQKQQAAFNNLQNSASQNAAGIFGTTPEFTPVDYTPLYQSDPGYANIANQVLKGDQHNLPLASHLTSQINAGTTRDAMSRVNTWDPSFMSSLNQLYANTNSALQGRLPYSDALQIAGGQGQLANQLGNAGGSAPQTAADLGQLRSTLMNQTGPNLLSQVTSILNGVDPVSNQVNASSFLINPSQGVQSAIQENQFGASFNEAQNLQESAFGAMPNPQAQGLFNLQALQAGLSGQTNQSGAMGLNSLGSLFMNPYVNGQAQQQPQFGQSLSPYTNQYLPYANYSPYGNLSGYNPYGAAGYGAGGGYGTQYLGNGGYVPSAASYVPDNFSL